MLRRRLILTVIPFFVFGLFSTFAIPALQANTPTPTVENTELSEIYTSADGNVTFRYPSGWVADTQEGIGTVILNNEPLEHRYESETALTVTISAPTHISYFTAL